jgi:xanthine dehydrogenase accessory factor
MRWHAAGEPFAVATVVNTFRSAPRPAGAAMAVSASGEAAGSVSGGCVEGAVYELAQQVMQTGMPVLQTYGISDDDAFAVGLTCGGILDVFVEPVRPGDYPQLDRLAASLRAAEPVATATIVSGPGALGARRVVWPGSAAGSLGSERLDAAVTDDVRGMLEAGTTGLIRFVHSYRPPPRMLVFGAIDFAAAVARIGKFLGYAVTVCDARGVFATRRRFPEADEVVVEWPHRYLERTEVDSRTVICVLTHDPKFDVPLLTAAVRTPAAYIGAMGSRRTHDDRVKRLREEGVTEEQLARISAPIGLDIGARTPEETAVSIAAEMVHRRWGGSGRRLTDTTGPIHHDLASAP